MLTYSHPIVQKDLEDINRIPLSIPEGNTILVTGANGQIATYIVYSLMYQVSQYRLDIHVIALSRNQEKAEQLFQDFLQDSHFTLLIQDVCSPVTYPKKIDYIFHFAGNASPYYIVHDPVGIMKSNLLGTINILELARKKDTRKVIFASTREVYGDNKTESSLSEHSFGSIDCMDSRSCYPESKRAAETLCKSYYLQYGVDFNTVRIAHTYGPGMKLENDGRVMADLLACTIQGRNIILKSKGEALRAFCYINDTIRGLFLVMQKGDPAEAYNLANETEEINIRQLAELLLTSVPEKNLRIEFQTPEGQPAAYCNYERVKMNTRKIENLGWKPAISLKEGVMRTIKSFER